ncbi:LysR substrate-binding domain-containing protein [Ottowia sp. VDI28]|uniref:LysR substrate-binding domain-containing protein n=1 Tax=Ottowia sp. VDI28 TaxID=3133968 RepID=UPI003C2E2329
MEFSGSKQMRDHQIRAWLRVVEVGSIRGAARSLNLTQAAVTKAIRELEEELDAPLLVRSSRGINVTDFGKRLTPRLQLAQAQYELARQDIRQLRGGEHAHVGVALTPVAFLTVLPQVATQFRKELPLANLSVVEGLMNAVVPGLRQGSVDLAVGAVTDALPPDLTLEPWKSLEMIVACRKGHPKARARSWNDLTSCDWLVHPSIDSRAIQFVEWVKASGLQPPARCIEVNTFGVTWSLLMHSDALLVCPREMLSVPVYGEQIVRVPIREVLPPVTLGLVTLRDVPLSYAAETLAQLFRRAVEPGRLPRSPA